MRITTLLFIALLSGSVVTAADAPAPHTRPAEKGAAEKWTLSVTNLPDGTKVVTARLNADAPIASGFGKTIPQLVLRYKAGRTGAYVFFDAYLGEARADVTVTFGTQPSETQRWSLSDDGRAAFAPGDALAFMQRLQETDSFSIRVTPPHASPVTASFTPTGVDRVIKALLAAGMNAGD